MSYFTVKDEGRAEFEERKSIFIGSAKRVYNEDEARNFINEVKSTYKDAKHNVYAYVIGENMGIQRYSDDGEPQGTGGIPVLETIKKNGITDTAIVVTRYFGGILLGTGGLVRAYSKGASMAIKESSIVEKVKGRGLHILLEYDMLGKVQYAFEQNNWFIDNIDYADKVCIKTTCESTKIDMVSKVIVEITSGKCSISKDDEKYYFKLDGRLW